MAAWPWPDRCGRMAGWAGVAGWPWPDGRMAGWPVGRDLWVSGGGGGGAYLEVDCNLLTANFNNISSSVLLSCMWRKIA